MTAKLITHEKDNEKTFVVTEAGLTIGRHADNQASLDDSRLSRFHARIKFKDGAWYAEDLGSTNGSFINDKKFDGEVKLAPGDKLRFGATNAELLIDPGSAAAIAASPASKTKTAPIEPPKEVPSTNDLKTAATIVAPLSSLVQGVAADKPGTLKITPVKLDSKPEDADKGGTVTITPKPVKSLVITPASPEEIAALDGLTPVEPAAAKPAAIKQMKTVFHRPTAGGLKPGLKLPPKPAAGLKPGLKLPPKPAGLKPGIKLPPKTSFQLKPGLKLPPKPGAGGPAK